MFTFRTILELTCSSNASETENSGYFLFSADWSVFDHRLDQIFWADEIQHCCVSSDQSLFYIFHFRKSLGDFNDVSFILQTVYSINVIARI